MMLACSPWNRLQPTHHNPSAAGKSIFHECIVVSRSYCCGSAAPFTVLRTDCSSTSFTAFTLRNSTLNKGECAVEADLLKTGATDCAAVAGQSAVALLPLEQSYTGDGILHELLSLIHMLNNLLSPREVSCVSTRFAASLRRYGGMQPTQNLLP
jgi:hypothetical protein